MQYASDPAGFLPGQAERSDGNTRHQGNYRRAPQREIQAAGIVHGVCCVF